MSRTLLRGWAAGGLALLLLGPAHAAGPEVWAAVHDGRLMESADRDPAAALAVYETLLTHLPDDDPLRGEILFWMGRAAYESGDVDGAIGHLGNAARSPGAPAGVRRLLARILMAHNRVSALPYSEDFSSGRGAWVRGWQRGDDEDLSVVETSEPGGPALAWRTEVREGESDFVVLPFDDLRRGPQRVRFIARAEEFRMHLRLLAEDDQGRRWTAPVIDVGTDSWQPVDIPMAAFAPAEAPASRERFDPARLRALIVRDVSSFHGLQRGENRLFIDDFEVR